MTRFKLPQVIAHRGAKTYAPENTLSAFRLAKAKGASWVEFDVQLSHDNELFVFHDDDLRRTAHIKGLARELTITELKQLDVGSWFSADFKNERIPTLRETIDCLVENKLNANLEIKCCGEPDYDERLTKKVCEFLKAQDLPITILVSSFSFDALQTVYDALPNYPLAMLLEITKWSHFTKHIGEIESLYRKLKCCSLNVNQDILDRDRLRILDFAEQIAAYTVNQPDRAKALFNWGVDSVFSDQADLLKFSF